MKPQKVQGKVVMGAQGANDPRSFEDPAVYNTTKT